jgi:hypothetical protein
MQIAIGGRASVPIPHTGLGSGRVTSRRLVGFFWLGDMKPCSRTCLSSTRSFATCAAVRSAACSSRILRYLARLLTSSYQGKPSNHGRHMGLEVRSAVRYDRSNVGGSVSTDRRLLRAREVILLGPQSFQAKPFYSSASTMFRRVPA